MIERPKRSVTRFFVPLIDVLILLFCIFLLMPFVASSSEAEPANNAKDKKADSSMPKDAVELQSELRIARREINRLRAEKGNLAERVSVKLLEIESKDGLFVRNNEGLEFIKTQQDAERIINAHKRASGAKEPLFLIVCKGGFPEKEQQTIYERWFKGVQFRFQNRSEQ
jgi:biopolymer transport protein ExbD